MPLPTYAVLSERGVIAVTGDDSVSFLQGIVSNDMTKISAERAGYGAFLTPQGKYLFDFFMAMRDGALLIECERARLGDFIKRLAMYKLRAKVDLRDASADTQVAAAFGDGALAALGLDGERGRAARLDGAVAFADPRLAAAGARLIAPADTAASLLDSRGFAAGDAGDYDIHRLKLGLPDGTRDLVVDKSTLMESGFDELGGIDWQKGCYMGQEVTARTKHRGLVKKRLVPVAIEGDAPEVGAAIMAGERAAGEMRSSNGSRGLALLRLDAIENAGPLEAAGARLTPERPAWARF